MDNRRQFFLLVVAVAAGIAATILTSTYISHSIQRQTAQLKEDYDAKQKEVIEGLQKQNDAKISALTQELQRVKVEQSQTMQRQITELQTRLQTQQKATAAAAAAPVKKAKPSLAVKTPPGKRAVTVLIDSIAAVGGLLNPGDIVDVVAQLDVPAGGLTGKRNVTAMVFQGLEVLAVNTNLQETGLYYDEQQGATALKVTVAVEPEEAGLLAFADQNGSLQLALRSPQDTDRQMVKTSTWKALADYVLQNQGSQINLPDELKELPPKPKATGKEVEKPTIQIYRGGKEL